MKIPKKFKAKDPETRGKNIKYYNYEFVKEYPNFIQYRCVENGVLECFQKSFFLQKQVKELNKQ